VWGYAMVSSGVHIQESLVNPIQTSIDGIQTSIDGIQTSIDAS
jgi:hypothetical protein